MTDLTAQTPVEIDTALAALYEVESRLILGLDRAISYVYAAAEAREPGSKPGFRDDRPVLDMGQALDKARAVAAGTDYRASGAQRALDAHEAAHAALAANRAEQEPGEAEYRRRGGWTRAFLVLNSNGHVHRDRSCSTCFMSTRYGWLPSLSGHDEAEIVDAAGADACTVCYPSAPVESLSRPRRVLHRTEQEAQAAREAKAAAKAEREALKAAKALVLDLTPFGLRGYGSKIETLAAAKAYLTDSFGWGTGHPSYPAAAVQHVAEAVALKIDSTPEAEIEAARKRHAKRR